MYLSQVFCDLLKQPKNFRSPISMQMMQKYLKDHPFFKQRNMKD